MDQLLLNLSNKYGKKTAESLPSKEGRNRVRPKGKSQKDKLGNDDRSSVSSSSQSHPESPVVAVSHLTEPQRSRQRKGSPFPAKSTETMDTILTALGCKDSVSRRYFSDVLEGKSIVLSNTNKQVSAISSSNRYRTNLARRKSVASTQWKKLRALSGLEEMAPQEASLLSAHKLWQEFMRGLMSTCSTEAQLKARLSAAGYLGARVTILREMVKDQETRPMITGFVCNESKNCMYVAHKVENSDTTRALKRPKLDPGEGEVELQRQSQSYYSVYRAIRKYCDIAVPLPDTSKDSPSEAILDVTTAARTLVLNSREFATT